MKILNYLFPFKLYLTIFQLEEYKILRFYKWFFKNPALRRIPTKKGLIITSKIKLIVVVSFFWFLLILIVNTFAALLVLLQPYILYSLTLLTLKPYEFWNKKRVIRKTRAKIEAQTKLKVVGITGSYAKTSVKEILYQLLKNQKKVLRTPESYNTIFGIAKVVDLELDGSYETFICELGAYKKGEIKELCKMVNPQFGVITGITAQHLERFKTLKNIIQTKFELLDYVKDADKMVFNTEDQAIVQEIQKRGVKTEKILQPQDIKFTKTGSSFTLKMNNPLRGKNKKYQIKTKLFGFAQVKNIALAATVALKLGFTPEKIAKEIQNLKPFANRFVLRQNQKTTIVDNTYNSNLAGFQEMLATAKTVSGKKALVTPGIVELGKEEAQIHQKLGVQTKGVFDQIVLVGRNKKTRALEEGLGKGQTLKYIPDTREKYNQAIADLVNQKIDWVFLENDVTENY